MGEEYLCSRIAGGRPCSCASNVADGGRGGGSDFYRSGCCCCCCSSAAESVRRPSSELDVAVRRGASRSYDRRDGTLLDASSESLLRNTGLLLFLDDLEPSCAKEKTLLSADIWAC